jgi:RNA polymerase sigma factor (sigma-70 family)
MSETEAVSLAQMGDSSAFEWLYNKYLHTVLKRCRFILRNEEEAQDVAQEVFLLLWRKIKHFRGQSAFGTWLHTLTTNRAVQQLRYNKSHPTEDYPEYDEPFELPNQLTRLEILEGLGNLTDLQLLCVEAEWSGQSLKKHGGASHLRKARHELAAYLV